MGLEAANYISDLIATNPTGSDPASSSDDHHRLVKKVLRQTFPNINGPVNVTPSELNTPRVAQGQGPGQGANALSLGWSGGAQQVLLSVDGIDYGAIAFAASVREAAPPGMLGMFFIDVPTGWIKANGAAVSRTTYARLFAIIGAAFGPGDGSTTFNVPDMRGLFPRSWDDARGIDAGRAFGSYQASANLLHNHGGYTDLEGAHTHTGTALTAGSHSHTGVIPTGTFNGYGVYHEIDTDASPLSGSTAAAGDHTHTLSIASAAAHRHVIPPEGATESRPHNLALLACIKY